MLYLVQDNGHCDDAEVYLLTCAPGKLSKSEMDEAVEVAAVLGLDHAYQYYEASDSEKLTERCFRTNVITKFYQERRISSFTALRWFRQPEAQLEADRRVQAYMRGWDDYENQDPDRDDAYCLTAKLSTLKAHEVAWAVSLSTMEAEEQIALFRQSGSDEHDAVHRNCFFKNVIVSYFEADLIPEETLLAWARMPVTRFSADPRVREYCKVWEEHFRRELVARLQKAASAPASDANATDSPALRECKCRLQFSNYLTEVKQKTEAWLHERHYDES